MLYGNIIFIKKTGGDGSKYPVTDKEIKIGRSEDCLIRIHNTQVAVEHCQLIIEDNGQATLKDLCKQTILNGNALDHEEVTLCHGDIFKVGERLARWEYLPTSKYYRQLLSPTGRLVAVVIPQQRPLEDQSTPGTSTSFVSVVRSTPVGGKRRCSERFASENASTIKMRKSSNSDLFKKSKVDLSKFLIGRHSLKSTKLILPGTKIRDRKSTSGVISSKTPKKNSRKSTLPSWRVNNVTPPSKRRSSLSTKSQRRSTKSPKNRIKNSVMDFLKLESETSLGGVKSIRTPQKVITTSEDIVKSASKTAPRTSLKTIKQSPTKGSRRSTQRFNKSPSPKKASLISKIQLEPQRLVHSEKKLISSVGKSSALAKELKRLSADFGRKDRTKGYLNNILHENFTLEEIGPGTKEIFSDLIALESNDSKALHVKGKGRSVKSAGKFEKTPRKSFLKKAVDSPEDNLKTPRRRMNSAEVRKSNASAARVSIVQSSPLIEIDEPSNLKKERQTPRSKSSSDKTTALNKTLQKSRRSIGETKSSSSQKVLRKTISPSPRKKNSPVESVVKVPTSAESLNSYSGRRSRKTNASRERTSSSRGVRRKLSPSISSAERAAKKLKTSSPKKPDKNKKAALLVLGKANRKHLLSQNMKVLLKQKLVKKAIKQSTTASAPQNDNVTEVTVPAVKSKLNKKKQKLTLKSKSRAKKKQSLNKENLSTKSLNSAEVSPYNKDKGECISKSEKLLEEQLPSNTKASERPQSASRIKDVFNVSNQQKKYESPQLTPSKSPAKERNLSCLSFEKSAKNFLFNSTRRCSKRLSSKNDTGRPDFVELSPTALGLIPKNLDVFKTPKQSKGRISTLVTPTNDQCFGIIRSASTSKLGNRKSVRFSSKDGSINSGFCSPDSGDKTDFDFGAFQTPDISAEVFISPLGDKSSISKKDLNESSRITFMSEDKSALAKIYKSNSEPRKCVRKILQSPQPVKRKSNKKELPPSTRSIINKSLTSTSVQKQSGTLGTQNSLEGLNESERDLKIFSTPKAQKNSKCSTAEQSKQVLRLLQSQKDMKSPKNDLSDLRGVKKLLGTPKAQKSPKNDLSDVRGVKKLLRTPKAQKSPKNDLSDLRGVKKLLRTPKTQKSPKNDLSDVRGVKKLLRTPKTQKSPKNDLSDVRGVKKLLRTPKAQKSPKNDLSDLRGVKKLLRTPKTQKSPKNDLSDVRGVKKLLTTPKVQKSPKNDLSDVRGVKNLMATPRIQKSPKNDLTDVAGVKELLKSPDNELLNLSEVKKFPGSPKLTRSAMNSMTSSMGAEKENIFYSVQENVAERTSPRSQTTPRSISLKLTETEKLIGSPEIQNTIAKYGKQLKGLSESLSALSDVSGMEELGVTKSAGKITRNKKAVPLKSQVNDFKGIKGSHAIYSTPKGPKNDLSDVTGVRELFSRNEPSSDLDISLTGIAQLFESPEAEAVSTLRTRKSSRKATTGRAQKVLAALESEETTGDEVVKVERSTRGGRLRKVAEKETTKRAVRGRKPKANDGIAAESSGIKSPKRKTPQKRKAIRSVKSSPVVKRSQRVAKETKKIGKTPSVRARKGTSESGEVKNSRKRKVVAEETASSPPKLRRKQAAGVKSGTRVIKETVKKITSRSKTAPASSVQRTNKSVRKASTDRKDNKTKTSSKVQNKRSQKSLEKNLSDSQDKASPVRTRSAKGKSTSRQKLSGTQKAVVEKKVSKSTPGRKKLSPVAKRSTRRK